MNVWLVGVMGSGKSSVASELARRSGLESVDLDREVAARTGCSIAHLWGTVGEAAFRDMEAAALIRAASRGGQVIATGGGAVLRPENVERMRRSGTVIWLDASPPVLAARLGDGDATRPLLAEHGSAEAALAAIRQQPADLYAAAAHHHIATDELDVAEVCDRIEQLLTLADSRIIAGTAEVVVGSDLVSRVGELLPEAAGRTRAAVLTQPAAAGYAADVCASLRAAGIVAEIRVLPDRDAAKTLAEVESTAEWLNEQRMTRADLVVGVGGGALTDVAGFVAATYLRGVDVVLVPTTLLGAVDAAIGGKTAVNVGGKNLVGVFRHPLLVAVDTAVLAELPVELRREGAAEALKAGLIADPVIVEEYEREGLEAPLAEIVRRAIAVKAAVVNEDFTEQGRRAILNYGHTIGHALEVASGISHGAAVGIGMVAAGEVSSRLTGFEEADRQLAVIERLGLPTTAPAVSRERVTQLLELDKKRDAGGLRMVVLEAIGRAAVMPVDSATVDAALHAVGL